jgi:dihydrofolate synthase/folylpolyglutamate synthase
LLPDTLTECLELLERRHPKAIDLGLERCREVWQHMGSPRPAPQVFVVAGTNGKVSTVATLCALLGSTGHRHGSYTSPHLIDFNERIRVGGVAVTDPLLMQAFEAVEQVRGDVSLTYFEFGTLAAFKILADAGLDVAVMEIGLGGRLDAVNLLDADCAVIMVLTHLCIRLVHAYLLSLPVIAILPRRFD